MLLGSFAKYIFVSGLWQLAFSPLGQFGLTGGGLLAD